MPELPEVETIVRDIRPALVGRTLKQLPLPDETLVISVVRNGTPSLPNADEPFRAGDTVIALVGAVNETALRNLLCPQTV